MQKIQFFATGTPKGQPRPRAFAAKNKKGPPQVRVYDSSTAEGWKASIAMAAKPYLPPVPLEGAISVSVTWLMPRPKRLMRKKDPEGPVPCTSRPDRDNLDKAVLDALTELGFWRNDSQVWHGLIKKMYHAKTGRPGAWILIEWENET